MAEPVVLLPDSDSPKELSIAETLIPWRKDDNRARFLGYLACGFSVELIVNGRVQYHTVIKKCLLALACDAS